MKKTRRGETAGASLTKFFANSTCSEYALGEVKFVQEHFVTPNKKKKISKENDRRAALLADPSIPIAYKFSPSYYYRDQIARCREFTDEETRYTDEVAKYVIEAVQRFGIDALLLNSMDKLRINPPSQKDIAASGERYMASRKEILGDIADKSLSRRPLTTTLDKETRCPEGARLRNRTKLPGLVFEGISQLVRGDKGRDKIESRAMVNTNTSPDPLQNRSYLEYLHPAARAAEDLQLQELRFRDGLGEKICDVLRFWRGQIQRGSLKERKNALKNLKAFGAALIPEARGKRQNTLTASVYEVQRYYLMELFRLYHVEHALKSSDRPRNHALRVKEVSENFRIAIELIRELWCLDEDDEPNGKRPIPTKEMARLLTGRQFRISQQRVANLL